jgi:lysozyme
MRTNALGVALIKRFEGLSVKAYKCPAGVWTIGHGHTGDVKAGDVITAHQAEAILDVDLDTNERIVSQSVKVPLTENQFSALVSFVFNVGPGVPGKKDGFVFLKSGKPSSMLRKLNAADYGGAAAEFLSWKYAAGRVLPGLVKRRAAERELFLKT